MRATGFLYEANTQIYLVTARHNVLPTNIHCPNPRTGGALWEVYTDFIANKIDMFLPDGEGWVHQRVLLEEVPDNGVISNQDIDILAVQLPQDSASYDLKIFRPDDLQHSTKQDESLFAYGYGTESLPSATESYSATRFPDQLQQPQELEVTNLFSPDGMPDRCNGGLGVALDEERSSTEKYNGMSGAPVLDEGLVGVHSGTGEFPERAKNSHPELENTLKTHYFDTRLLQRLNNRSR